MPSLRFGCLIAAFALAMTVHAHELISHVSLTGSKVSPPTNSPAIGSATITIDFDLFTMRVEAEFSGLQGTVTSAHIHAATAEENSGTAGAATQLPTFEGFPPGVTSGVYDHTFDLTDAASYNPDFITANGGTISTASNAFFDAIALGRAYLDIHTTAFGDGEIRGFLIGPKRTITRISASADSAVRTVTIEGFVEPAGATILIERSSDLQNWQTAGDAVSDDATGDFSVELTEPVTLEKQFYRVLDLLERAPDGQRSRTKERADQFRSGTNG